MKRHFLYEGGQLTEANGGTIAGKPVENQLDGQAAAEQINEWKAMHTGGIYAIESDGYIGYFREPTRHDVNKAYAHANDEKPLQGLEEFARLTFIGGSKEILRNDLLFLGAQKILKGKMGGTAGTLVNL
jgi:hypothetical protein